MSQPDAPHEQEPSLPEILETLAENGCFLSSDDVVAVIRDYQDRHPAADKP